MKAKIYVRRESCTCSHDLIREIAERAFDYLEYKYGLKIDYELEVNEKKHCTIEVDNEVIVESFNNHKEIIEGFEKFLLKKMLK